MTTVQTRAARGGGPGGARGPRRGRIVLRQPSSRAAHPPTPDYRLAFGEIAHRSHVALVTDPGRLVRLARELGVAPVALLVLEVGIRPDGVSTWPMCDRHGDVIGIRLRGQRGRKWAVAGSRHGIFGSVGGLTDPMLVTEGATDAAAAITLGYAAIGRAAALPGRAADAELASVVAGREVVVIPDRDSVGGTGARAAVAAVVRVAQSVRVVQPPRDADDLREALRAGVTRPELAAAIAATEPVRLRAVLA